MKRGFKIIAIMIATIVSINNVKAEDVTYIINLQNRATLSNYNFNVAYNLINENTNYNYYAISLFAYSNTPFNTRYQLILFNDSVSYGNNCTIGNNSETGNCLTATPSNALRYIIEGNTIISQEVASNNGIYMFSIYAYGLYDTNYNFETPYSYTINNYYNDSINLEIEDNIPSIKNLDNYNSWSDYESNYLENYTEVNLNNYEYVILTLKDYNQTEAFQTNLQVKGQIGITPIYNFGQTSKDSITGSQVQDRCNVSYNNYTSYPFYIIQSDLQNNVVYAVKSCEENSAFKFDNTIFNITYITGSNVDDPVVTINGKQYHVIPYDELPSTATKNEEDNYIPGQSGSATDSGGLDSAIKGAQQKMSEIWNTFTYFTDFINQIFSVFPDEVKTILISAFTIMIIIGIIKIFIN